METSKTRSPNKLGRPDKESLACKARGREATMDKLLLAGIHVFSTHGYDAATTKLVAKEAGINESLINRYFEGKAGLLLAIIKAYMDCEKAQNPKAYPEGETVEQELKNFFAATFKHQEERSALLKIFVSRAIVDTKVRDELKTFKKNGASPALIERLTKLQKRGLIRREVDVEKSAAILSQACFGMGFINYIVMGTDRKFVQDAMNEFARDYVRGLTPAS